MSAFVEWLADAGKSAGSAAMTGASQGLAGSLFGRSGFQRKKDQMQLNEQMMQIQQQLALEAYQKQQELIKDQREYDEKQWNEKNSPEAIVRNLEKAGINAAQFLSGGSSSIQPFSGGSAAAAPMAHSSSGGGLSYQTPQFPGNPLALAQLEESRARVRNIDADTRVKDEQAPYYRALTDLKDSEQILTDLNAVGVGFANDMKAVNLRVARALEDTNVALGKAELSKMVTQTDLFRRQIRDLDDKHDLHGMRKQELKNQLDIQVASEAVLWAREAAARKGLQLTDGQIALIHEQALKVASDTDLNEQLLIIKSPEERDASYRGLGSTFYDDVSGPVGSAIKTIIRFFEKSNAERPEISIPTRKANSNVNRVRNNLKGK